MARSDDVRAYYAGFGEQEWARLTNPAGDGVAEFAVTTHAIATHLHGAARVLDIGGGPGRYTIWLAEQGYRVVLADLSPAMLRIARREVERAGVEAAVEEIAEADACDLSRWPDRAFDAALCLGPFYHLPHAADRQSAAAELARVVRPGGTVFVALMPRLTLLRRTLALADERHHLAQPDFMARLLQQGIFLNDVPGRFTAAYGACPQEVAPFFERHGFTTLALLAAEGIAAGLGTALAELAASDPAAYRAVLDVVVQTAGDSDILGTSNHLLYVGRRNS